MRPQSLNTLLFQTFVPEEIKECFEEDCYELIRSISNLFAALLSKIIDTVPKAVTRFLEIIPALGVKKNVVPPPIPSRSFHSQ